MRYRGKKGRGGGDTEVHEGEVGVEGAARVRIPKKPEPGEKGEEGKEKRAAGEVSVPKTPYPLSDNDLRLLLLDAIWHRIGCVKEDPR